MDNQLEREYIILTGIDGTDIRVPIISQKGIDELTYNFDTAKNNSPASPMPQLVTDTNSNYD